MSKLLDTDEQPYNRTTVLSYYLRE